mmetsp:Transcript_13027/g.23396  ORF Transcript_13027/g.23396 Transcript_13027/m.23396 type:complete len:206 (+) Transcript_13027:799-1416(+)
MPTQVSKLTCRPQPGYPAIGPGRGVKPFPSHNCRVVSGSVPALSLVLGVVHGVVGVHPGRLPHPDSRRLPHGPDLALGPVLLVPERLVDSPPLFVGGHEAKGAVWQALGAQQAPNDPEVADRLEGLGLVRPPLRHLAPHLPDQVHPDPDPAGDHAVGHGPCGQLPGPWEPISVQGGQPSQVHVPTCQDDAPIRPLQGPLVQQVED